MIRTQFFSININWQNIFGTTDHYPSFAAYKNGVFELTDGRTDGELETFFCFPLKAHSRGSPGGLTWID